MRNNIGKTFTINNGYLVTIVKYSGCFDIDVVFEDGHIQNVRFDHLRDGLVKNFFHKNVYGVGYLGGRVVSKKAYSHWRNIFHRCYDEDQIIKSPSYAGCNVDVKWHNFKNFEEWFLHAYNVCGNHNGDVDKDILIKGNKTYGEHTCLFVPREINVFYKTADKKCIEKHGNKYRVRIKGHPYAYFKNIHDAELYYKGLKSKCAISLIDKYNGKICDKTIYALKNYNI